MKAARIEAARAMSTTRTRRVGADLAGDVVPMEACRPARKLAFTVRVPIGVIGAISPFNFPLNLSPQDRARARRVPCRAEAGLQTPLSALLLAELEEEADCPPAGSASSFDPRRRSATCWSRTSA